VQRRSHLALINTARNLADPTHETMMVGLLAGHTSMTVLQATDGMPIKRDCLYIIPPGKYLFVEEGALLLSEPHARCGARLPFDFLLNSLAADRGSRAICIFLLDRCNLTLVPQWFNRPIGTESSTARPLQLPFLKRVPQNSARTL
jgi:hypothetical protein